MFWRGGRGLRPLLGPAEPVPQLKSEGETWSGKLQVDDCGRHPETVSRPRPCGALAPPPDRQWPMSCSCRRPLRTTRTLPAADAASLALRGSFHGDRGPDRAAWQCCHGDNSGAGASELRRISGSEPRGATVRSRCRGSGGALGSAEILLAHRYRRHWYRKSAEGREGPP